MSIFEGPGPGIDYLGSLVNLISLRVDFRESALRLRLVYCCYHVSNHAIRRHTSACLAYHHPRTRISVGPIFANSNHHATSPTQL